MSEACSNNGSIKGPVTFAPWIPNIQKKHWAKITKRIPGKVFPSNPSAEPKVLWSRPWILSIPAKDNKIFIIVQKEIIANPGMIAENALLTLGGTESGIFIIMLFTSNHL